MKKYSVIVNLGFSATECFVVVDEYDLIQEASPTIRAWVKHTFSRFKEYCTHCRWKLDLVEVNGKSLDEVCKCQESSEADMQSDRLGDRQAQDSGGGVLQRDPS